MRRLAGILLVAVGVAALTFGIAGRWFIYPALAQAPAGFPTKADRDRNSTPPAGTMVSEGRGVKVFVARKVGETSEIGPRTLTVTSARITRGLPEAARGETIYWESSVETGSTDLTGTPMFQTTVDGICFDRVTGAAAKGCAKPNYTRPEPDGGKTFEPTGQIYKFPFDTQKTSYPFWDGRAGEAVPALYNRQEVIDGLTVYTFVQTIPDRVIGTQDLPGSLFGSPDATVTADQHYANVRTLWVEPQTGVIIRGQEELTMQFVFGAAEPVPALVGTIGYTDATVKANVAAQRDNARSLRLIHSILPPVGIALGLLLTALGLWLGFGARSASGSSRDPDLAVDLRERTRRNA